MVRKLVENLDLTIFDEPRNEFNYSIGSGISSPLTALYGAFCRRRWMMQNCGCNKTGNSTTIL